MPKVNTSIVDFPWHSVPFGVARHAKSVARCAKSVARRAINNRNPLITNSFLKPDHQKTTKSATNLLFLLAKTALQPWLRQVCTSDRSAGPKHLLFASSPRNRFPRRVRSPFRFGSGVALIIGLLSTGSPTFADGWTSAASRTDWSSAARFTPAAPQTQVSTRSQSFVDAARRSQGPSMDRLLSLISRAESPRLGYDSIHHRARIKTSKPPSQMTIAGIQAWVRATPRQPHAIGRYQVIPDTFNRVVGSLGLSGATLYDRRTQDLIGRYLIEEAGYSSFRAGRISRETFMDNLAKVWAGLPLRNGRSAYHGYAGNRATISRADYAAAMAVIFPLRSASQ